jgi:hypothetical protein
MYLPPQETQEATRAEAQRRFEVLRSTYVAVEQKWLILFFCYNRNYLCMQVGSTAAICCELHLQVLGWQDWCVASPATVICNSFPSSDFTVASR